MDGHRGSFIPFIRVALDEISASLTRVGTEHDVQLFYPASLKFLHSGML
jgi:hypothetical protein